MSLLTPHFMSLAPRQTLPKEADKIHKVFSNVQMKMQDSGETLLNDKHEIKEAQNQLKEKLSDLFKDRVDLKEKRYNAEVVGIATKEESREETNDIKMQSEEEEDLF